MKCYAILSSILLSMVVPSSASYSPSAPESSDAYDKQPAAADAEGAVNVSKPTAPPKKRDSANAVMNLRNSTVSIAPSEAPSGAPSAAPSAAPSRSPSALPSLLPTSAPSCNNTRVKKGKDLKSESPSAAPSVAVAVPTCTRANVTVITTSAPTIAPSCNKIRGKKGKTKKPKKAKADNMARLKDKNEKENDKDKKIKGDKPSSLSSGYGATESLDEDDNVY